MRKRTFLAILLVLVAILTVGVYAYFHDSQTVTITAKAATLKLGEVTVIPANLGDNLKPGDKGNFVVNVVNAGTIPGNFQVKLSGIPEYLNLNRTTATGEVAAGATVPVEFKWEIPFEKDLGTGGQTVDIKVVVNLTQKP